MHISSEYFGLLAFIRVNCVAVKDKSSVLSGGQAITLTNADTIYQRTYPWTAFN